MNTFNIEPTLNDPHVATTIDVFDDGEIWINQFADKEDWVCLSKEQVVQLVDILLPIYSKIKGYK
jgi:hypothetical protein